jgi:hypothetical protein
MSLDTALRRGSAVHVGMPWRTFLPFPDGTIATEDRYAVAGYYSGLTATVPVLMEQIANIAVGFDTGTHQYNLSLAFTGATSYAIAPAVETGWSFDVNTGVLEIDTDDAGTFGTYVVTASNAAGDTDSNAFTVSVLVSSGTAMPAVLLDYLLTDIFNDDE